MKSSTQIETREARYGAIRKILEENVKLRDKAEERFQSFFEKEVHTLHNQVREEWRSENVKMMRSLKP